ncbi:hypothetical protein [Rugamonas aquatica]|uniref:Uncharacterized protein n=1 Tax=Rugamonas aquatica TaxID=2743357 RepID=A0A6A7N6D5_9BURK|nr:hypothetical protein [Rugamonas aquatica]MQA40610.1 hypothetical protein [Rugamonas aquatica]
METIIDKVIEPAMALAIHLQLAESRFLDYQMQQGADALSTGRVKLAPAYQQHHERVSLLRRQFVALLRVSATPLRKLACWHCGTPTMGRPWFGMPTGKGLCAACIGLERQRASGEPLLATFGIEGVHCGDCEAADHAAAHIEDSGDLAWAPAPADRNGDPARVGHQGAGGDVIGASLSAS